MKTFRIKKELKTEILITQKTKDLLKKYLKKKNLLICDKNTYNLIDLDFEGVIKLNSYKDTNTLEKIFRFFLNKKLDRNSLVICVSGGGLSDIVGFACSVWMRGVDYILIPTTLLSQIDASIGGKTAIDWFGIRNILGSFYFPLAVIINPDFTLKQNQHSYTQAFGEIFKYIIIMDKKNSNKLFSLIPPLIKRSIDAIKICIEICTDFKIKVVEKDPFDRKGIRMILNFGHTPAHAIESIYKIPHGDAVFAGCIFELMLSRELGYISDSVFKKYISISNLFNKDINLDESRFNDFIKFISYDKKNKSLNTFLVKTNYNIKVVNDVSINILKNIWRKLCRKKFL